ncbi:MAG TPA: histidinol-phosphatase, partial [Limnochordales bacterium]
DQYTGPCPYTVARIEEYVRAAERRGVAEIGISEHCHRFVEFREVFRPVYEGAGAGHPAVDWLRDNFYEPLERYVEAVTAAKERGLPVKLGLELDWFPWAQEALAAIVAPYPWDYILGSVHFLDGWPIDVSPDYGWPERDVAATYEAYFAAFVDAAKSGLFDIMAHPDLIKKFGHRIPDTTVLYRRAVDAASEAGVALEISTAGLRVPAQELYPAPAFLKLAAEAGLAFTLGSDAHDPADVGRDVAQAAHAARAAGGRYLVRFTRRQRELVPLSADP